MRGQQATSPVLTGLGRNSVRNKEDPNASVRKGAEAERESASDFSERSLL
jgi:hypothetical protein